MEAIVDFQQVIQLIPQKPPMVMIDKLIYTDELVTRTGLLITDKNIFCTGESFTEPGIIENIAQTAAIRAGYYFSKEALSGKVENPPIGFIGGIKNLVINFLPLVGQELITEIKVETEIMGATVISAITTCEQKVVAECEMKIFIVDKEH